MALGALISGGLVWWHPVASQSALLLPGLLYLGLGVVHLTAVLLILKEPDRRGAGGSVGMRRAAASVREAPIVVREGLSLLRHNRVLGGLVAVELFWSAGMVVPPSCARLSMRGRPAFRFTYMSVLIVSGMPEALFASLKSASSLMDAP